MKSALTLVAFKNASPVQGVIALLETALDALDRNEMTLPAAYVEHTLQLLHAEAAEAFNSVLPCN